MKKWFKFWRLAIAAALLAVCVSIPVLGAGERILLTADSGPVTRDIVLEELMPGDVNRHTFYLLCKMQGDPMLRITGKVMDEEASIFKQAIVSVKLTWQDAQGNRKMQVCEDIFDDETYEVALGRTGEIPVDVEITSVIPTSLDNRFQNVEEEAVQAIVDLQLYKKGQGPNTGDAGISPAVLIGIAAGALVVIVILAIVLAKRKKRGGDE